MRRQNLNMMRFPLKGGENEHKADKGGE